jgi:hypothetical protein
MKLTKSVNIPKALEMIYEAQARMQSLPDSADTQRETLRRAVDSALSVVVIYLKLGREPRVMEKHHVGIVKLERALEETRTTC